MSDAFHVYQCLFLSQYSGSTSSLDLCIIMPRAWGCVCVSPCLLPIHPLIHHHHPHIHLHTHTHSQSYTHTHRHIHSHTTTTTSKLSHGQGQEEYPHEGKKAHSHPSSICSHAHMHTHTQTHPTHALQQPPPTPQRLKFLLTTGYAYARPVAYYGMIPFVLYVGMNGDAAPNWSDLPRYLLAVF